MVQGLRPSADLPEELGGIPGTNVMANDHL